MENEQGFHWNVWFIGKDGFRESFNIEAETSDDISARREAILSLLSEVGAVPDTRPFSGPSESKGPSKLDKFKKQQPEEEPEGRKTFVPSTEPETKEETVAKLQESGVLTEAEAKEVAEAVGVKSPTSDRLAAAKAKSAAKKIETPASTDVLKPSKLAKYAKPEKE